MIVFSEIDKMKAAAKDEKLQGKSIGLVPTMGYLHEGHLSLVRESVQRTDCTVVSIFVNPAQFGPQEDFKEYPRDLDRDSEILRRERVDYLFVPDSEGMYPEGYKTYVEVHDLQDRLCGRSRPGHFRGVCTVVLKLFNIIKPDISFFGQKDAQQSIILKRMAQDLNLDVTIQVLPIVREKNGLAVSSRNTYLNKEERKASLVVSKSLGEAQWMIGKGERDSKVIRERMIKIIDQEPLARIDYIEIVDLDRLNQAPGIKNDTLVALAVFIGGIRLIDNTIVRIKE